MAAAVPRDALGLGLRPAHYPALFETWPELGFFEIIAENFLGPAELPRSKLARVASRYPVVAHGVSLNLMGADPLDLDHLTALRDLVRAHQIPYLTDHLCWTRSGDVHHHELLPAPYHPDLIAYTAERAAFVQDFLGVPFGIENLSSYLAFARDELEEWTFYRRVVEASGCWFMLDVNNVVVSAHNHGFDPHTYLDAIDWDRVLQVHLAGHEVRPDGMRHDTHNRPVCDEVWALYRRAWQMGGPFPTLLEWDDAIPPLEVALAELHKAAEVRR